MVRRNLLVLVLIYISFLLQSTVFHSLSFAGIVPNLMLIAAASSGFLRGEKPGIVFGFLCGILMDMFFSTVFGMYALIYMYIGYLNGKVARLIYPDDIKLPLLMIAVSDLAYGLFCYIVLFLLRGRFHFGFFITHVILPEVVYTVLVFLVIYPLILRFHNHFEVKEKGSAKEFV